MEYPGLAERTGGFRYGAPHAVTIGAGAARVVFLRSAGPDDPDSALWVLDRSGGGTAGPGERGTAGHGERGTAGHGERGTAGHGERLIADGPIEAYAIDREARVAAFARAGGLFRADLDSGAVTAIPASGPVHDPRPSPSGRDIGYVTEQQGSATLRVVGPDGDRLLAGEPGNAWREHGGTISWGVAESCAQAFGRTRGWWWSPEGGQILAVRTAKAASLHLLDLDGGWVDVHWDRETYPYLAQVRWESGGPLITVLRRMQQHGLVLSVDPRTGETQVHAELADARWVEPVPGTPRHLPDGRVLVGGELAHDGFDARCLFADGSLLTPPGLYVRRVAGTLARDGGPAGSPDLVVEGSLGDPAVREVFRVRTALGGGGPEVTRIAGLTGQDGVVVGGDLIVSGERIWSGAEVIATLGSAAEKPPYLPQPVLERVTDRRLPAAVLYPTGYVAGTRLPVLLALGAGPGHQQVRADTVAWQERQWWADAGFAVVSIDPRGTPGVAPSFEKAVHRRLADVILADLADALQTLIGKHPDLDLARVGVRGHGLGGWLAAMAVLRRPDDFHRAAAREPVIDWHDLPAPIAERYLGDRSDAADVYAHHSLRTAGASDAVLLIGAELAGCPSVPSATLEEELAFLS